MKKDNKAIVNKSIENWKTDRINSYNTVSSLNNCLIDYKTTRKPGCYTFINQFYGNLDKIDTSSICRLM
jgi:hypothetical protein